MNNIPITQGWKSEVRRIASFGAVGVLNALVNYAIFMALAILVLKPNGLYENRSAIGLANVAAWAVAVTNSYIWNAKTTFKRESGGTLSFKSYFAFAGAGLIGMVAETGSLLIANHFLELWLAKLISIGCAFTVNFLATRLLVFGKNPSA